TIKDTPLDCRKPQQRGGRGAAVRQGARGKRLSSLPRNPKRAKRIERLIEPGPQRGDGGLGRHWWLELDPHRLDRAEAERVKERQPFGRDRARGVQEPVKTARRGVKHHAPGAFDRDER